MLCYNVYRKLAQLKYAMFICVKEMTMCKCRVYTVLNLAILSLQLYAAFVEKLKTNNKGRNRDDQAHFL